MLYLSQKKALILHTTKLAVTQMIMLVFVGVKSIVGKGENAGYQHFLFFHTLLSNCPVS